MKKLETQYSIDAYDCADKINQLIDLVNSQQEAIEKLERVFGAQTIPDIVLPTDDKPEYKLPGTEEVIEKLDKATLRPKLVDSIPDYTHRTVTLRIPERLTITEALWEARIKSDICDNFWESSDTALQKALDEVEHE